jgi:hypothetical protein
MGTAKSGLSGHIRGWDVGVQVYLDVDSNGDDVVEVYRTGGSNGFTSDRLIATITQNTLTLHPTESLRCTRHDGTTLCGLPTETNTFSEHKVHS